jgi:hypothetical protein
MCEVILSVYFEGTANPLRPHTTQVGLFAELTDAVDVTHGLPLAHHDEISNKVLHYKIAFDGCGVTDGCGGTLFAFGLKRQCKQCRERVQALLTRGHTIRLNCLGLSRGGMAAMYLTQLLADFDSSQLALNLCLFDPVPGNLIFTASVFDWCFCTTANQALDLSSSKNLRRVLAIYPHEPLPDIAFHAPILGRYPEGLQELEEEVTLGCHQGALFLPPTCNLGSSLSFLRVKEYLEHCGTRIKKYGDRPTDPDWLGRLKKSCVQGLETELQKSYKSTRHCHHHRQYGPLSCRYL